MAPKKQRQSTEVLRPAYEALYHAIGDAADKYSTALAPVRRSARFQDPANHPYTVRYVRLDMQKLRNTLLPKFRSTDSPVRPITDADYAFSEYNFTLDNMFRQPKYGHRTMAYYKVHREEISDRKFFTMLQEQEQRQQALLKNVVKAAAAAEADFLEALAYYEKEEQVTLNGLPKTIQVYPKKVVQYFQKLQKKAASALEKSTQQLADIQKKLAKARQSSSA